MCVCGRKVREHGCGEPRPADGELVAELAAQRSDDVVALGRETQGRVVNGLGVHTIEIHSGPDCMHRLALMSTGAGFFNALSARVFASRSASRFLYPFLRAGRNLTLRVLGRRPIAL